MNILLFTDSELTDGDNVRVSDRRHQHLLDVLGARIGETVRVGQVDGACGLGKIIAINEQYADLRVSLDSEPPPKLPLTLVLALPRPKMLRRILRTIGECGVGELHLINSFKVEKSYWQSPLLSRENLRDYLLAGLEQASDTRVPEVALHPRFKPFAEDLLPDLCSGRHAMVAHPGPHVAPTLPDQSGGLLVIGPEGGFTDYEVGKCCDAGCETVSLGPRVLRVETAVGAALGAMLVGRQR